MNKLYKSLICLLGIGMALVGCRTLDPLVEEIDYARVLTPLKFEAEVVPSTGTDVIFSWQKMTNAEGYELEIFEQTDGSKEVTPESNGVKVGETYILAADENPYTVYGLEVDKSFYARIRGINSSVPTSNWAYLEKTFSTSAVRNSLNPVVTARTDGSITIAWDKASDKEDLTSVQVEKVVGEGEPVKVSLTSDDIAAASKTIDGLEPAREYRLTLLFGKAGKRGSVTAFTRPTLEGVNTVYTAGEIYNAINNQAGTVKLLVAYSDAGIDMKDAYPDPAVKVVNVAGDVYLYGDATEAGAKPSVSTLVFSLVSGAKVLHLEDLNIDGGGEGALVTNAAADMTAVEYVNCEISGFTKAIYSVAGGANGASVASFLVDGCYVHDINAAGTEGGDFIDVRNGVNGSFVVRNSTFYACARTFFRISDNAKAESVLAENCTFNLVTATKGSSNNAGIFAVRVVTGAKSLKAVKNVFLNEFSEGEDQSDATKCFVRLNRNSTDSYRVVCEGNVYYNVGAGWFVSQAVAAETDAMGDKPFEEIAMNEGQVLTADPCVNSIAGKLYLTGTEGERIKSLKAGDPRWWDAVQPVIIREKELKVVESDYTWDFTEKTIYDTEELLENTIIGNARIYATSTVPANVVMSKGIDFSTTAAVSPEGVPSYSAVEILTSGYGSVKVTGDSEDGIGTFEVLAGGDRYAVLADGQEHTVVLGDLVGENSIYVIADSPVTLKKITWTKDLTPDETLEILATPKLSVSPSKVEEGTSEPVVFSWAAIDNAEDYVLTFQGMEYILTEPSYTVDASIVAALAVGEYPVTVKARPVSTSSKYAESEVAEATFTVNKKPSGGTETTLTWDFSSAEWQEALAANAASAKGSNQSGWTVSVNGLTYTSGSKNGKWDASGFIQPNGGGSATERVFSFEAPADGTLKVTVSNPSNGTERTISVVDATGTVQTKQIPTTTDKDVLEFDVKAGPVAVYPNAGVRFWVFEFTYISGGAAPLEYDWDFSSAEWQEALATNAASAKGSNQSGWTVSVNGLTYTSGSKNGKWDASGFIQPNGGGSATERVFSFDTTQDGTLQVTVSNPSNGTERTISVVDATGTVQTKQIPTTTDKDVLEFDVKAGTVLIYPNAGVRFWRFQFKGVGGGAPITADYVWTFSDAAWQTEFAKLGSPGVDITTTWDITVDGLNFYSTQKNRYTATALQIAGAGSKTDRVLTFDAPAPGTVTVRSSNTGNSEGAGRNVSVAVDEGEAETKFGGTPSGSDPTVNEYAVAAGKVYIFTTGALRIYSVEFHTN